jgi:hypothetical protein
MNLIKHITFLLFLTTSVVQARTFAASNYEDCVLDGVKHAKTNAAVAAVYQMCERKFPKQDKKESDFSKREKFVCDLSKYNRTELFDFSYDLNQNSVELNGRKFPIFRLTEKDLFVNLLLDDDVLVFNLQINQLTIRSGKNPSTALSMLCSRAR